MPIKTHKLSRKQYTTYKEQLERITLIIFQQSSADKINIS